MYQKQLLRLSVLLALSGGMLSACSNDSEDKQAAACDEEHLCDAGLECMAGFCKLPLVLGDDCTVAHSFCKDGECTEGICTDIDEVLDKCSVDNPCADDKHCDDGLCKEKVQVGDACNVSDYCVESVCKAGICEASGAGSACGDEGECSEGLTCKNDTCQVGVTLGGSCEEGKRYCEEGICLGGYCLEDGSDAALRLTDSDGDTISDYYDRCDEDTDGDTIPNCLDLDSDGDTIPDSMEAYNDGNIANEPIDSDYDGVPDFLDLDSDGNGIPDAIEGKREIIDPDSGDTIYEFIDADGDTILDSSDFDNDGDGLSDVYEIRGYPKGHVDGGEPGGVCGHHKGEPGTPEDPWDCDGDTIPDYNDPDSDGDTIPDIIEGLSDTDGDGLYDRYVLDSDGDTIPDSVESGGVVPPRDTDGDTIPDYQDLDSDNDGLPDSKEIEIGTDPYNTDTDGDGVSDMVEYTAGTDPLDPSDNPEARGDFVFVVPYQKPTTPDKGSLSFATSVQVVDAYFAIDSSGSMDVEIKALQDDMPSIIAETKCNVVEPKTNCLEDKDCAKLTDAVCSVIDRVCIEDPTKKVGGCVANMWTGLAFWGNCGSFSHRQDISADADATSTALGKWKSNNEGSTENPFEAAACAVSAEGAEACPKRQADRTCAIGGDTCAGFRDDAIRILVMATDEGKETATCSNALFKAPNSTKITEMGNLAGSYAAEKRIKVVGLHSTRAEAKLSLEAIVKGSGTVDSEGSSDLFIIEALDKEVVAATKSAIMAIAKESPLKITTQASDIDAGAAKFIESLTVNIVDGEVEGKNCTKVTGIIPGKFEGIAKLRPGLSVCYDLKAIPENNLIKAKPTPQLLKAKIAVKGDGSTLSERIVYFVIPPVFEGGIN